MQITRITNLIVNFDELSSTVKEELQDFISQLIAANKLEELLTFCDDLSIDEQGFTYFIKENYQHVQVGVIGLVDSDEVELTLKGYN